MPWRCVGPFVAAPCATGTAAAQATRAKASSGEHPRLCRVPFLEKQPFVSFSRAGPVSETVTLIVGHALGKAEALRRLRDGLARSHGQLGPMITIDQETWQGDSVRFGLRALGQSATTSIEVLEESLRIDVSLPWLLAKAAKRLLPVLRKEATLLLEKK